MTSFIGPRTGWDDHSTGTIRIEIDLELWASSGRAKHTDITEQGAGLAETIVRHLKQLEVGPDVAIHDLRYYGAVEASSGETLTSEVGVGPADSA